MSVATSNAPSIRLSETEAHHFLGIDVGGTDVKFGLVDHQGKLIKTGRESTPVLGTPRRVFDHALRWAAEAIGGRDDDAHVGARLTAVGVAVPGVLDTSTSRLREVVNLPGWLDVPLLDQLQTASGLPSAVLNDANAAALAEHAIRGLGRRSLALVTLGTGIGCGLVLGGEPFGGDHGCAGELGHIAIAFDDAAIPCTCGSRGHLESYAGAAGVTSRLASKMLAAGRDPRASAAWTPREISRRGEAGDDLCIEVIDETAIYVGRAIGLLSQSVDPAVVLLGGAMTFGGSDTKMGQRFLKRVLVEVRRTTLVQVGGNVVIEFASLKNEAGMLGAAMHASTLVAGNLAATPKS